DARIEIEDALSAPAAEEPETAVIPARPVLRRLIPWSASLLTGALIAGLAVWNLKPSPPKRVARTVVALPLDDQLVARPFPAFALSPDGALLAYEASRGGNPANLSSTDRQLGGATRLGHRRRSQRLLLSRRTVARIQ